jgi:hypothetical protein
MDGERKYRRVQSRRARSMAMRRAYAESGWKREGNKL